MKAYARAWWQAARPPAQLYLASSLLLGLACADAWPRWQLLACLALYSVFLQLMIVFTNDYGDRSGDALNSTPSLISGGSRVLQEGLLHASSLRRAALVAALIQGLLAAWIAWQQQRVAPLWLSIAAALLIWAYSLPPLSLASRGFGELLQTCGLGLVLPAFAVSMQQGLSLHFFALAACMLPAQFAAAMASALPDAAADRRCGKWTFTARRSPAQLAPLLCGSLGLSLVCVSYLSPEPWTRGSAWANLVGFAALIPIYHCLRERPYAVRGAILTIAWKECLLLRVVGSMLAG